MVAFMACLIGYGEVGLWITKQALLPGSKFFVEGNPYQSWIEGYAGAHYQTAVGEGISACFPVSRSFLLTFVLARDAGGCCQSRPFISSTISRNEKNLAKVHSFGEMLLGHGL
jgi:hypothetical protein